MMRAPYLLHRDVLIPLSEHKCPRVLSRQGPTLQQLRRMHPVMRANYEKRPLAFRDGQGLFTLDLPYAWSLG